VKKTVFAQVTLLLRSFKVIKQKELEMSLGESIWPDMKFHNPHKFIEPFQTLPDFLKLGASSLPKYGIMCHILNA